MTTTHQEAGVHHRVRVLDPHSHRFEVTLTVARPAARQRLALPVWIPGSYLVREFSQHLLRVQASQNGQPVTLRQLDKNTWQAERLGNGPLTVTAEVYAFDASVRTAWLDASRGFFNPTSLCLRVLGQEDRPHTLELAENAHTKGWQVATGLRPLRTKRSGFGSYHADHYDELADSPVEMGRFWSGSFKVRGVPHRFVVSGVGAWFDGERLLRDTRRIVEAQMAFWHGAKDQPAFDRYVFMLHATDDGYGGLEHRHSTALIAKRADLPRLPGPDAKASDTEPALKATDGYTTLLGLISHEYFHTWNVKRLRPAEFRRYDYDRENHTELLWFFEGFTSYYDDLLLRRAGLITPAVYLQLLGKTANQVLQTPGREVQSVAQASFEAWTKYYRVQENTANATVSYYTKGALVAACIDLTLRAEGRSNLDEVMRALWQRCDGGPMKEADLLAVLRRLGGRDFGAEIAAWVHGTAELPLPDKLRAMGLLATDEPAAIAQRLGLRVSEGTGGIAIKTVLHGSVAAAAGLAAGDDWLGIELDPVAPDGSPEAWRVNKLDDVVFYLGPRRQLTALLARDKRLLRCPLTWPAPASSLKIALPTAPDDSARWKAWLG
ncbi:M61 family metallopeptidase [Hydrogenophaga sp. OTU3427]|uniref:M61 family metallopeptidase n=1 Tax=Hydrogenophaga sp. OTU3427 TaxID=3043856 RepID=UPI00313D790F